MDDIFRTELIEAKIEKPMLPESLWADLVIGGGGGGGKGEGRGEGRGREGGRNDTLDTWLRVIIIP